MDLFECVGIVHIRIPYTPKHVCAGIVITKILFIQKTHIAKSFNYD